jgi:hypothetical protein
MYNRPEQLECYHNLSPDIWMDLEKSQFNFTVSVYFSMLQMYLF